MSRPSLLKSISWKKGAKKDGCTKFPENLPMSKRKQKMFQPQYSEFRLQRIESNLYEIDPPEYFLEQFQRIHVKNILVTHLETKNEYTLPMK